MMKMGEASPAGRGLVLVLVLVLLVRRLTGSHGGTSMADCIGCGMSRLLLCDACCSSRMLVDEKWLNTGSNSARRVSTADSEHAKSTQTVSPLNDWSNTNSPGAKNSSPSCWVRPWARKLTSGRSVGALRAAVLVAGSPNEAPE